MNSTDRPPLHSSVRTATSLNVDHAGQQWLCVRTTRLVMHRVRDCRGREPDGTELNICFEESAVTTRVVPRAANDDSFNRRRRPSRG